MGKYKRIKTYYDPDIQNLLKEYNCRHKEERKEFDLEPISMHAVEDAVRSNC